VSASAPDRPGLDGDQVAFLGRVLSANARWSASIHNAALDGQERASNEWAQRYLNLAAALDGILRHANWRETETDLYDRLARLSERQGFYPGLAAEQLEQYRERKEREAAEHEAAA